MGTTHGATGDERARLRLLQVESCDLDPTTRDSIATIHKEAYGRGHFTSAFRPDKLREYYGCLIDRSDYVVIASVDGTPAGFLIAGKNIHLGVAAFVGANRGYLAAVLLAHPRFLVEKVASRLTGGTQNYQGTASYRLLSIATRPRFQSKRVGEALIEALETELLAQGIDTYGLSVRKENSGAIRFYRRLGFVLERETKSSAYYTKSLTSVSAAIHRAGE